MTVTISRLYDSYAQATEAVSNLEKAGVPHSDISIVSNNSDNWYSENTARRTTGSPATVDRDREQSRRSGRRSGTGAGIGALQRLLTRSKTFSEIESFVLSGDDVALKIQADVY